MPLWSGCKPDFVLFLRLLLQHAYLTSVLHHLFKHGINKSFLCWQDLLHGLKFGTKQQFSYSGSQTDIYPLRSHGSRQTYMGRSVTRWKVE